MPHHLRALLILLAISTTALPRALAVSDTTTLKKNVAISPTSSTQAFDMVNEIRDGLKMIQADSVQQGIHLIVSGIKSTFAQTKVDRVMNFSQMEFIELAKMLDGEKLPEPEKKLGLAVFKTVFKDKTEPTEKNMEPYFKAAPNSQFVKRIRLLMQTDGRKQLAMLDKLLKEYPDVLSFTIYKAEWCFNHHQYADCIPYCDRAIALWPSYAYAYHLKARCEGELDKYNLQLGDENKAISYFSRYPDALYYRAMANYDLDKYKEAIADFLITNKSRPGYVYTNYFLAKSYNYLDNADSALYYANQHLYQYPNDDDGYDLKGDLYYNRDDYSTAVEYYSQAIKLDPGKLSFREDRGNAYFYWKKIDTAMIDFRSALKLDKMDYYALERIGDCYYEKENYDTAIIYHEKALKINPNYKFGWMGLYYCYDKQEKFELAINACQKALAIDSTYDSALGDLGWEYYRTGHYDECIDYSYRCLKYDEKATYAMFNIALATLKKGDFDKAKELYKHFFTLCKEKNHEMTGGAVTDLRDLIKANVDVEQATVIIRDIFGENP